MSEFTAEEISGIVSEIEFNDGTENAFYSFAVSAAKLVLRERKQKEALLAEAKSLIDRLKCLQAIWGQEGINLSPEQKLKAAIAACERRMGNE